MNAIILAAGMGTRLRPLTENKPKSLVEVLGEPIVERQIKFLKEKNINDITVVTGYLHEQFEYLKERYGVKLVHNDKYNEYNNVYTMYLVKELLGDSYVLDADVYLTRNYINENIDKSTYFSGIKENFDYEWQIVFDDDNCVSEVVTGPGTGYINSGVTYWSKSDGERIKEEIEKVISCGNFKDVYWDDVVTSIMDELNVSIEKIDTNDWFEIDSVRDLKIAEDFLYNR